MLLWRQGDSYPPAVRVLAAVRSALDTISVAVLIIRGQLALPKLDRTESPGPTDANTRPPP